MARRKSSKSGWPARAVSGLRETLGRRKVVLHGCIALAAVGLAFHAVQRIWRHGRMTPAFQFRLAETPPESDLSVLRPGLLADFIEADEYLSRLHSIFESGMTGRVAERLRTAPWVRSVPYVRTVLPNRVEWDFEPRTPLVRVLGYSGDSGRFLADRDGVRLNRSYYSMTSPSVIVFDVTGVNGPAPAMGERWKDDAVRAAGAVARKIKEWKGFGKTASIYQNEIVGIDVSNFLRYADRNDRNEITLVTRRGTRIKWGSPPGRESPFEVSVDAKLASLHRIYRLEHARRQPVYDVRWARAVAGG